MELMEKKICLNKLVKKLVRKNKGFTLIEVVISIAIVIIVFVAVSTMYSVINRNIYIENTKSKTSNYTSTISNVLKSNGTEKVDSLCNFNLYIYFSDEQELISALDDVEIKPLKLKEHLTFNDLSTNNIDNKKFVANIDVEKNIGSKEQTFQSYSIEVTVWFLNQKDIYNGKSTIAFNLGR